LLMDEPPWTKVSLDATDLLQKKVGKGDPCAIAELGGRYLNGHDAPRRIAAGVRLFRRALARGATIGGVFGGWHCDPFYVGIGTQRDLPLALQCYLRSQDYPRAALMVVNGQGTKRDVDLAAALLPKPDPGFDCAQDLRRLVAKERAKPDGAPPKVQRVCDVLWDSNHCGWRCEVTEKLHRVWKVEQHLTRHGAGLSAEGRKHLAALVEASKKLARDEGQLIYLEFSGGSIRNEVTSARELLIEAHFEDDLAAFFDGKLRPADVKALKLAQRALKVADVAPSHPSVPGDPGSSNRDLRRQWRLSRRRWREYVQAWERLATLAKPSVRPALLRRLAIQRLHRCLWTIATTEQPRVVDKFFERLRRVTRCPKEEAATIRASLKEVEAFESRRGEDP
jgi:hypothetical protein